MVLPSCSGCGIYAKLANGVARYNLRSGSLTHNSVAWDISRLPLSPEMQDPSSGCELPLPFARTQLDSCCCNLFKMPELLVLLVTAKLSIQVTPSAAACSLASASSSVP